MLDEVGVSCGHERKRHGAGISHIGCGVQPVLEEKECREGEPEKLALSKEIYGKQQGDEPLQQRSAPKAKCWTEPSKQKMPAFVNDKVGRIDEEELIAVLERVKEKDGVECDPS